MRVRSWEESGLQTSRVLVLTLGMGTGVFALVLLAGQELHMGTVSPVLGTLAAAGACYFVATGPRRRMRVAAFLQTSEAPSLAASSNIYLKSSGSRSKTLLILRAEEPMLRAFLSEVRRMTLLGHDAVTALHQQGTDEKILSESTRSVLHSVAGMDGSKVEEGSDELDGMLNASDLDQETKLPILIAVSFFLPIMLMLFAAMTRQTGPLPMGALFVLEVVILDLTLAISSDPVHLGRRDKP